MSRIICLHSLESSVVSFVGHLCHYLSLISVPSLFLTLHRYFFPMSASADISIFLPPFPVMLILSVSLPMVYLLRFPFMSPLMVSVMIFPDHLFLFSALPLLAPFIDHYILFIFSQQLCHLVEFLYLFVVAQFLADQLLNMIVLLSNLFDRYPLVLAFLLQVEQLGQYHVPYNFIVGQILGRELFYFFYGFVNYINFTTQKALLDGIFEVLIQKLSPRRCLFRCKFHIFPVSTLRRYLN